MKIFSKFWLDQTQTNQSSSLIKNKATFDIRSDFCYKSPYTSRHKILSPSRIYNLLIVQMWLSCYIPYKCLSLNANNKCYVSLRHVIPLMPSIHHAASWLLDLQRWKGWFGRMTLVKLLGRDCLLWFSSTFT